MTRARRPEDRDATDRLLGALTEDADALEAICEAISAQEAAALDALLDHAEAAREDHT